MGDDGEESHSLLYVACKYGHAELIQPLIKAGCDPYQSEGVWEETPLSIACKYGHDLVVRSLLKNGCNITSNQSGAAQAFYHCCYHYKYPQVFETLIEFGINVRSVRHKRKRSPVLAACHGGKAEVLRRLIEL